MKKITAIIIVVLILTGCGKQNNPESINKNAPVVMSIYWGLPVGINSAMSPALADKLRENNINPTIDTDAKVKDINFSSIVNDQVLILSEFLASIILKDNPDWRVVGRLNSFRVGIMVPNDSTVNNLIDLKGKALCGNIALIKTLKTHIQKLGITPENSGNFIPLDDETVRNMLINSQSNWPNCEAIIVSDSLLAYFQEKNLGKTIDQDKISTVIMARNNYIQANPEVMVNFFRAFSTTLEDFRKNMISEKKFSVEGMPAEIAPQVYHKTYDNEENFDEKALNPLRFYLNKDEIDSLQSNADLVFDYVPSKPRINVNDYIDVSYAAKAMERKPAQ